MSLTKVEKNKENGYIYSVRCGLILQIDFTMLYLVLFLNINFQRLLYNSQRRVLSSWERKNLADILTETVKDCLAQSSDKMFSAY